MNLVTTAAKFCRLFAHERFEKHATMRFGIQLHKKIVEGSRQWILRRR
jgi:hypothetical protein